MLAFPASPSVDQQYQTWVWDGSKWAPAPSRLGAPQCGRLQLGGASPSSSLNYVPYKGNTIKINGVVYPFGTLTASASAAYINGVGPQALANNTFYYVYAWVTSGSSLALDFSTTGHATSTTPGNAGVEIKSGDDSRTLVGCVYTAGTNQFYDQPTNRYLCSWFNRPTRTLWNNGSYNGFSNTTPLTVFALYAINFAGEQIGINHGFTAYGNNTGGTIGYVYVDGVQCAGMTLSVSTGYTYGANVPYATPLSEGILHTIGAAYSTYAGVNANFAGAMSGVLGP